MNIRLSAPITKDSIVDGEGLRAVIWTQGCAHNCEGCHNPETHSFSSGVIVSTEVIKEEIKNIKNIKGITLSGGDPIYQASASLDIASYAKSLGLDVWLYTGFTFEELINTRNQTILKLLNTIDVLVDGMFELSKRSLNLMYRGSTNQRIIDTKQSLKQKKVVLFDKYEIEKTKLPNIERQHVYI